MACWSYLRLEAHGGRAAVVHEGEHTLAVVPGDELHRDVEAAGTGLTGATVDLNRTS